MCNQYPDALYMIITHLVVIPPLSSAWVPKLMGFSPRGNKRIAGGGNGGLPRIDHYFHLIVTGIAFPRFPKSEVDRRGELSPASPLSPMQYTRVTVL